MDKPSLWVVKWHRNVLFIFRHSLPIKTYFKYTSIITLYICLVNDIFQACFYNLLVCSYICVSECVYVLVLSVLTCSCIMCRASSLFCFLVHNSGTVFFFTTFYHVMSLKFISLVNLFLSCFSLILIIIVIIICIFSLFVCYGTSLQTS
jgi:hypothetical protein